MRKRFTFRSPVPMFRSALPIFLLTATGTLSFAAVQSRISSVNESSRVAVTHTIPARALTGTDLGVAASDRQLSSLMLTFSRTEAQQAALTQLLIDLQDPSSPRYHAWLTPEQFGAQFGLSAEDLTKVSTWLTSKGFKVTSTGRGSDYIAFTGTVAQAESAFGTSIHTLMIDGEQHLSNMTDPTLPTGIATVVTNVGGLNDLKLKARARTRTVKMDAINTTGLQPKFTSAISGSHFVAPGDFYTIYDMNPLLASTCGSTPCNGIGVGAGVGGGYSIAVVGQTNISLSDVTAFRTASGLCTTVSTTCPNPLPTVKLYGTSPGSSASDLPEAMLDVEWSGATAPNANIVYVNSTNVITGSLLSAINDNLAPIISISYGDCEVNFGTANLTSFNQFFQRANAQGQTIVGPSGDSGATDCDYNSYPAVGGFNVDFPSSSPYVTSAGGSMFIATDSAFWGTSNGTNAGSALGYIPETVWNESTSAVGLAAGGGGSSAFFTKPYWQTGTSVPNDFSRDVPDISLNAASGHDGSLYCVSNSCVTGFRAADGQSLSVVGGTSVASPSFAGVLALVEQKIGSRIGNTGPVLYALGNSASSATVFHDIVSGNNNSACTAGTKDCPSGGSIGYTAAAGYDLATGLGSIDVYNLAIKWNTVTPPGAGTVVGQNITSTIVTTTSPVCGVASGTITMTVKVSSGAVSTVAPTGTVQLLIDNVVNGAPAALSNGTASLSFSTAGVASGGHTISAVYSGDVNYAASKGFLTADVVSSTKADFAFTPCTASTTIKAGGVAPGIVFTVAPVNGFTGSVTFSATSANSLAATFAFSVTPLVINSTSSGTTNFVLTASTTKATTSNSLYKKTNSAKTETSHAPWYVGGSGVALASALLLTMPRRRRWGALLVAVLSVAAFGVTGCGSGTGTLASNTGGTTTTTTNATPGTYNVRVTATATTSAGVVVHSTNVAFIVQ
jgi:subtilase family serine protease